MLPKLLVPIVGLGGTIMTVVGVSNSNHRSTDPAEKKVTHKWEIDVDKDIGFELTCVPEHTSTNNSDYGLRFKFDIDNTDRERLISNGAIRKVTEIEFWAKGDWKEISGFYEKDGVVLEGTKIGEGDYPLMISLGELKGGDVEVKSFKCKPNGTSRFSGGGVEKIHWLCSEMIGMSQTKLVNDSENGLVVDISTDCSASKRDTKEVTCELKVTTANYLDWSNIINKKAKFKVA